jgi:pimeloyl-ACP methyl ester carboxylesterase
MGIERHFVTIGQRQVHYRRAGDGPVLLMLHASLNTSATFLPLIGPLAADFTVIAMDTPGYGLSEVLSPEPPEIEDYADGVIEFMDALGLERVALYGMLTGTMIGVDLASRYPQRFAAVILNTMLVHTDAELAEFEERFTPPMPLRADGLHIVQAWDLMRRNAIAYPWFKPGPDTRFDLPLPEPEELHLRLLNCLSAGTEYGWGAKAAFRYLRRASIADIRAPTVFFSDRAPPFGAHAERLAPLPEGARIHWFDDWGRLAEDIVGVLKSLPPADPPPPPPAAQAVPGRVVSDCVSVGEQQLHLRRCDAGDGRAVLLVHGAGGTARCIERYGGSLLGRRPVLALDWPGHGESGPWPDTGESDLMAVAELFLGALKQIGSEQLDIFAVECGAAIAGALARLDPDRIRTIAWNEVLFPGEQELAAFTDRYAPVIEPDHDGGYLLEAWSFVRDQGLYLPWFDKSAHGIIWDVPAFDLERTHEQVLGLLKALTVVGRAYGIGFDAQWWSGLARTSAAARICTYPGDSRSAHAARAAEKLARQPMLLAGPHTHWVEQALS